MKPVEMLFYKKFEREIYLSPRNTACCLSLAMHLVHEACRDNKGACATYAWKNDDMALVFFGENGDNI